MNKVGLMIFLCLVTLFAGAQNNNERITQIETDIKIAVEKGEYETAATLKKEKNLLEQIDVAVKNGDYQTAAKLKKEIEALPANNNQKIAALEAEIKEAANQGEYEKAAELQKEIEALKNGEAIASETVNKNEALKPEFTNQVYIKENGVLKKLEKQEGEIKTSVSAAPFYSSASSYYFISGTNSDVSAKSNSTFIVEAYQGVDPSENFKLVKFDPDKNGNDRYMPYYKTSGYAYGANSGKVNDNEIPVEFNRLDGNIFEIKPKSVLVNGEYGFVYINKFYCFRIGDNVPNVKNNAPVAPRQKMSPVNEETSFIEKKDFFIDLLVGVNSIAATYYEDSYYNNTGYPYTGYYVSDYYTSYSNSLPGVAIRFGSRWNFGSSPTFRLGLQVNWGRLGLYPDLVLEDVLIHIAPVNVGLAGTYAFNKNMGIEASINGGFNAVFLETIMDEISVGFLFNPQVKFRYKKLNAGLDIAASSLRGAGIEYDSDNTMSSFIFSGVVGLTF